MEIDVHEFKVGDRVVIQTSEGPETATITELPCETGAVIFSDCFGVKFDDDDPGLCYEHEMEIIH